LAFQIYTAERSKEFFAPVSRPAVNPLSFCFFHA
jgi:hypothetical protein